MPQSRRRFLARTTAGLVGAAAVARRVAAAPDPKVTPPPAGMPTVYGTAPPVGPEITPATVVEAQKLVRIEFTGADQAQIAESWARMMAGSMERRTGPRKLALEDTLAPATLWNPMLAGRRAGPTRDRFVAQRDEPGPASDERRGHRVRAGRDAALALDRVARAHVRAADATSTSNASSGFDPKLRCIITLTQDLALAQAKQRRRARSPRASIGARCTASRAA